MANVSIANTTANISGKTVVLTAVDATITGLLTYNRSPSAPFAVASGSAKVDNLIVDAATGVGGTGQVPVARLGSGTGSSSNYLRGDGSWAAVTAFNPISNEVFS